MGIEVNLDLETNRGPTKELYFRIDSYRINSTVNEIIFTTTSWLSKEYADRTLRTYVEESIQPSIGLVSNKVIDYSSEKSGKELLIENLYKSQMSKYSEIDEPIYEEREISKELPYVSFDEDGNEITLYRTVTSKEKVQVSSKKITKEVVDHTFLDNLKPNCYNLLKKELSKVFPDKNIKILE
jgi:hypothetical protein